MKDCVFNNGNDCSALNDKDCRFCTFCKTEAELKEGREKALERINNLPNAQKTHIIRKYYRQGTRAISE